MTGLTLVAPIVIQEGSFRYIAHNHEFSSPILSKNWAVFTVKQKQLKHLTFCILICNFDF